MKRAIIVGSAGQDGRLLWERLCGEGCAVLGIDLDGARATEPLELEAVDILSARDVEAAVAAFRPDEIYYLAAVHHASEEAAGDDRRLFDRSFAVNVFGLLNFLEAVRRKSKDARLFYAASSHVFGRSGAGTQDERTPFDPVCIYGITKAAGVGCCRFYREAHAVFAAAGILFNHESPWRRPEFVSQKIVRGAVEIRRGERSTLVIGDLDAEIDWGYAPDYVDAMTRILRHRRAEDFIVATGESHSVREFVETAFGLLGLDWKRHVREDPSLLAGGRRALVGNAHNLRSLTGWKPSVTFEQMIGLLVRAEEDRRRNA